MILFLLILAALLVGRYIALPRPATLRARRDVVAAVRRGSPYAYQYVLVGGNDHDRHKVVVRADQKGPAILVRSAAVDRQGRRTGRSRVLPPSA